MSDGVAWWQWLLLVTISVLHVVNLVHRHRERKAYRAWQRETWRKEWGARDE